MFIYYVCDPILSNSKDDTGSTHWRTTEMFDNLHIGPASSGALKSADLRL